MIMIGEQKVQQMIEKTLDANVYRLILKGMEQVLVELDPEKHYIMVLPETISVEESRAALEPFLKKMNMAVIHASGVKVLEIS